MERTKRAPYEPTLPSNAQLGRAIVFLVGIPDIYCILLVTESASITLATPHFRYATSEKTAGCRAKFDMLFGVASSDDVGRFMAVRAHHAA